MGNDICFLITVLHDNTLIKCALKVKCDQLSGDVADYPMEPENLEQLHNLLPEHVRSLGNIVDVNRELFEIHSYT